MIINGTNGNDTLIGTVDDNEINGLAGNDFILDKGIVRVSGASDAGRGVEDDDLIIGGIGDDTLVAGVGNDTLTGGLGGDIYVPNVFDNIRNRTDNFSVTITDFNPEEGDLLDVSDLSLINNFPNRSTFITVNDYGISFNSTRFD